MATRMGTSWRAPTVSDPTDRLRDHSSPGRGPEHAKASGLKRARPSFSPEKTLVGRDQAWGVTSRCQHPTLTCSLGITSVQSIACLGDIERNRRTEKPETTRTQKLPGFISRSNTRQKGDILYRIRTRPLHRTITGDLQRDPRTSRKLGAESRSCVERDVTLQPLKRMGDATVTMGAREVATAFSGLVSSGEAS